MYRGVVLTCFDNTISLIRLINLINDQKNLVVFFFQLETFDFFYRTPNWLWRFHTFARRCLTNLVVHLLRVFTIVWPGILTDRIRFGPQPSTVRYSNYTKLALTLERTWNLLNMVQLVFETTQTVLKPMAVVS